MLDRWEQSSANRRLKWREEIRAQAQVDRVDAKLDRAVGSVADDLLFAVDKDRTSPRFKRYFPVATSQIIRLGLEAELKRVRTWPDALEAEPDRSLKEHSKPLGKLITEGDEAIAARTTAFGDTANHRIHEIVPFVDDLNATRLSVWTALLLLAQKHKLGKAWPDEFFRKTTRAGARAEGEPEPSPEPAPDPKPEG